MATNPLKRRGEKPALEQKAMVFKALAHPARLWMVERVLDGECCVCELVEGLGLDFSTVSKHLSILRAAAILQGRKEGKQVYCSLAMPCVRDFLRCLDAPCDCRRK